METIKKAAQVLSGDTSNDSHGSRGETTSPKPGDTILLTGATGFVAGHILNSLLNAGFKVKATVHSKEKAARLMELYPSLGRDLEVIVVEDIAKEGAFDEAVKGVTGVVHAAYPHVLAKGGSQELLDQAVAGATGILNSIVQYNPDIKRVVLTSAFAAMNDQHKGNWPGHTYSEADWNPIKYQEALESTDHNTTYSASKTFAERACWDFVSHHTETTSLHPARFTLTSILLPAVIGPIVHDLTTTGSINNSIADIYRLISGCENKVPMNTLWAWADVRDVADAHVAALLAQGKEGGVEDRFLAAAGTYNYYEICKIIEQRFPELVREGGTPHATEGETPYHYKVNNARVKNELGIKLRGLEESIVDTVKSLLDYEERTRRGETKEVILAPVMTKGDEKGKSPEYKQANVPYSVGDGKKACNCGGKGDECTCAPGTCACAGCTKKAGQRGVSDKVSRESPERKQANAPYSVGGGKTACNCGGRGDECTCAPETCACTSCTKRTEQREQGSPERKQANAPYSVGGGKTACNCGGKGDECTCAPGTCACASCTKKIEQREISDKVSMEGKKVAEKITEAVESEDPTSKAKGASEHTQQSPGAKYAKLSGKIDCYCGRGEDNCICPPETCGCRGCARKRAGEVKFEREEFGTRQGGGVSLREETMDA